MVALSWVASIAFLLIDYNRFAPCVYVFFVLALGGLLYAETVARRQGVRAIARVPSWRVSSVSSILFGVLFLLDPSSGRR